MRFGEKLRRTTYCLIDFIKGAKVHRHYQDIKYHIEDSENEDSVNKRNQYLKEILTHSVSTVVFHKNIVASNIENFPVINKEIIRNSFEDFQSNTYKNRKKVSVTTSGSTGKSFEVFHNINKKNRSSADIIYFSELAGYKLGYKLYYLRFWHMFQKKSQILRWVQHLNPIDVFNLSDSKIKSLLESMKQSPSNKSMIGYASIFKKISNYLDSINSKPIDCNIKSIIGISERLDPVIKASMKKYFNVDMVSRYSNAENGMLAQQPKGKEYYEINWASYYIEILNLNNDMPTKIGELGRIVITDLFNYCMPIIRYDTGDVGIMDIIDSKKVLTKVEGRIMDMLKNTSGEILSTSVLMVINKYTEILQRQIIQKTNKEYLFKLKIENDIFERQEEFVNEFKNYFGEDAVIKFEFVDEIPLLPSGKQQATINEVKG
jgi:phenylacetate-CoA ligase